MNHTIKKLIKHTFITQNPLEGHFDIFAIVCPDALVEKLVWLVFQKNTSDSSPWRAGPLNNSRSAYFWNLVIPTHLVWGASRNHIGEYCHVFCTCFRHFPFFSRHIIHSAITWLILFSFFLSIDGSTNTWVCISFQLIIKTWISFQWFIDFKYVGNSCQ